MHEPSPTCGSEDAPESAWRSMLTQQISNCLDGGHKDRSGGIGFKTIRGYQF